MDVLLLFVIIDASILLLLLALDEPVVEERGNFLFFFVAATFLILDATLLLLVVLVVVVVAPVADPTIVVVVVFGAILTPCGNSFPRGVVVTLIFCVGADVVDVIVEGGGSSISPSSILSSLLSVVVAVVCVRSIPTVLLLDKDNFNLSLAVCVNVAVLPFFLGGLVVSADEWTIEGSVVDDLDNFNFNLKCFLTGDSVSDVVSMGLIPSL